MKSNYNNNNMKRWMKKSSQGLVMFFLLFHFTSCSDFLDKTPYTLTPETFFNNEAELSSFLTGTYSPIMQEQFYGNFYPVYLAGGDDLTFFQRATPTNSIICANANSSTNHILFLWRLLYAGINRANTLIESVDRNPEISKTIRDRSRAEALVLRSFYYFHLIQGWGDVPLKLESTEKVTGLDAPRVDKQIIYDTIIADIANSIPYLYKSTELKYTGRLTQSAAKGILARIYLFRAGEHFRDKTTPHPDRQFFFSEARRWALEVKESGLHGLVTPYNRVFLDLCEDKYNSTGVLESIWEAEEAGNRTSAENAAGRIGNTIGFGSSNDYSNSVEYNEQLGMRNPGYGYKFLYGSLKLYEMYENEGDTARGNWNIANYEYVFSSSGDKPVTGRKYYFGKLPSKYKNIDGSVYVDDQGFTHVEETQANSDRVKTRCAAKYRREYELLSPKNKNYTPINFPILRYSDILLMIAEADNELTAVPSDLAYECIDDVRTRAGITPLKDNPPLTKEQFRNAIKKERAMEFCFEALRRWDLIRWGDFYQSMLGMQSYVNQDGWGAGFKYAIDYYKISEAYNYFPIPEGEMAVNKLITTNNPGW
ncbi:MAG: RagB/SusD family nutrient uptake outer membrane protein [Paludibacter sp.]|nr:RagB/SusD family nutrient uptake outer membrane protein [Paludibacter sp.]